jgi:hypothetical protein
MADTTTRPSVVLRFGNLFDGPSDLVILPCSTYGTITPSVAVYLIHFEIPTPRERMRLGEVDIVPFAGAEHVGQFVGFAASVEAGSYSVPAAIEEIGQQVGEFTKTHPSVRAVSVPLLGTGAGGLSPEESVAALSQGFRGRAALAATLTIHVLDRGAFQRLKAAASSQRGEPDRGQRQPLRLFISYTQSSQAHSEWVASLAAYLRENGVDARLDQWHLRRGMDLPQWMCNELAQAHRVLIVSNEAYAQRANGRHGGVGWETMVIQGDIARLPPDSTKYVLVVREEDLEVGIPLYMRTKFCIHWPQGANDSKLRSSLLRELYEIEQPPPLGEPLVPM